MGYELPVEYGKIREFAAATQATDPAYWSARPVIPATFLCTARLVWEPADQNPITALGFDPTRILHGEEEYVFHGPLPRAGDVLTVTTRLDRTWEKEGRRGGRLRFAGIVNEFRDEAGGLVAEQRSTVVETERPPDGAS